MKAAFKAGVVKNTSLLTAISKLAEHVNEDGGKFFYKLNYKIWYPSFQYPSREEKPVGFLSMQIQQQAERREEKGKRRLCI